MEYGESRLRILIFCKWCNYYPSFDGDKPPRACTLGEGRMVECLQNSRRYWTPVGSIRVEGELDEKDRGDVSDL